jgi:hypothetical protein
VFDRLKDPHEEFDERRVDEIVVPALLVLLKEARGGELVQPLGGRLPSDPEILPQKRKHGNFMRRF